ncbi:MAG: PD-(D/E)XK nuclease family protein [Chloroflexota bacterium]
MVTSFWIAPAGFGKTRHAVERVRALLTTEPLASVVVILPNQLQVAEFRRRLASAGGALGAEFMTFHALYAQLLAGAGRPLPRLFEPVQVRLLRSIVDAMCDRGEMRHYAALRARPGFVAALRNTFQELKQAKVFPDDFATAAKGLGPRLEELSAVYTAYQEWLRLENWADAEGQGWLAAIALEENLHLGRELRLLVVDGFDEFNPTQLGVLARLVERAQETLITFTGEVDRLRPAHNRFRRARDLLTSMLHLQPERLPSPGNPRRAPALACLEEHLFEHAAPGKCPPQAIEFIEAQTQADEARAALRWVKARLVRDKLQLSDVAILGRDIETYRPLIEEIAAEFGLPVRTASGLPLIENPAVAALLALLELPASDWARRHVIDAWRSPYFDWSVVGLTGEDADRLDLASRQGCVVAGLAHWNEAFDLLEKQNKSDEVVLDEEAHAASLSPDECQALRARFESFVERLSLPAESSVRAYVAFIEDLIGDDPALASRFSPLDPIDDASLRVLACVRQNPATAERDVAALRTFKDALRGLVLAEATLGKSGSDYASFIVDLRAVIKAAAYRFSPDAGVLVTSVLDGRGLSFDAVALLGLSEGQFPQVEREDVILWENDRAILRERGVPVESRLRNDEASFFYQAVTRPCQRLLLTRPYLAEDGHSWEPSPYWQEVLRLVDHPVVQRARPEEPVPVEETASEIEFIQSAKSFDAHLARGATVLRSRLERTADGEYEGDAPDLAESLETRYGPAHGWSASRLETYGTCPFCFYVAYALELEPLIPPEDGYDVRILGSMLHQILENTYRQATDPANLEECLERLPEVARSVFVSAPADYGFRPTPLWVLQQKELETLLRQTIVALANASAGYTPRYFEERFGLGKPPLVLHTELGDIRLHGYIDRIDAGADGRLRVVDYKAGGSPISATDLAEGRRLQLPIYALAAREALGLGDISNGFYWHIQRAEASRLKLENYEGGVQAAFETAVAHIARHVTNIRAGRFQPRPPSGGCPSYCPASNFCWRYRSKGY